MKKSRPFSVPRQHGTGVSLSSEQKHTLSRKRPNILDLGLTQRWRFWQLNSFRYELFRFIGPFEGRKARFQPRSRNGNLFLGRVSSDAPTLAYVLVRMIVGPRYTALGRAGREVVFGLVPRAFDSTGPGVPAGSMNCGQLPPGSPPLLLMVSRQPQRGGRCGMDVVLTRCAGLDVHQKSMTACRMVPDPIGQEGEGSAELKRR